MKRVKNGRRDAIYFFTLALYLLAKDLEISSLYHTVAWIPQFLELLRYISYALIIYISVFMTNYCKKVLIRYIVFMLFFVMISLVARSVTILFNFMFIFAAKDISIRKIIKYVVTFEVIITMCIFLGSLTGIIEDWTYYIAGRYRHSMGYGYPNAILSIFFYSMITVCYLLQAKLKLWHVITFEIINFILFYYTNTRTAFALTAIALVVFWAVKFRKKALKPTLFNRLLYVHSIYLIALFAIAACLLFNPANPLMKMIDAFISNRLSMGHNALMINKQTLFGQKIQWYGFGGLGYTVTKLGGEYNNVDCSYVKILLDNGIVMLSLAIIGYMLVADEKIKEGNRYFCIALLFANIYAMIEPRYIETGFNPFVWCLSSLIENEIYILIKPGRIKLKSRSLRRISEVQNRLTLSGIKESL